MIRKNVVSEKIHEIMLRGNRYSSQRFASLSLLVIVGCARGDDGGFHSPNP